MAGTPNVQLLSIDTIQGITREANRIKRYIKGEAESVKHRGRWTDTVSEEQMAYHKTKTALGSLKAYVASLEREITRLEEAPKETGAQLLDRVYG